jgi:hypothetical protein
MWIAKDERGEDGGREAAERHGAGFIYTTLLTGPIISPKSDDCSSFQAIATPSSRASQWGEATVVEQVAGMHKAV